MRYRLSITADDTGIVTMYNVILIDGNANLVWNQNEDYLYYKKSINGTFILNCHDNSSCYGAILALSICNKIEMDIWEDGGTTPIYQGYFYKRDCTIDEDRGSISFTPKEINPYDCLEKRFDVELNILAPPTTQTILDNTVTAHDSKNYETYQVVKTGVELHIDILYDSTSKQWQCWYTGNMIGQDSYVSLSKSDAENSYYEPSSVTLKCTHLGNSLGYGGSTFDVTTNWVRKSILTERLNNGANACLYGGVDNGTKVYNGTEYDVCIDVPNYTFLTPPIVSQVLTSPYDTFTLSLHTPSADDERAYTKCKKLHDVIMALIEPCGFSNYISKFLRDAVNPLSGVDLRYLYVSQMSDCIWVDLAEEGSPPEWNAPSDPATKGMMTIKQLFDWLKNMFQVYPYIHTDGTLYLEHIRWFKNGHTYTPELKSSGLRNDFATQLDPINIETLYVNFAKGMNKYSYEGEIPLYEKISYAQKWNEPFRGTPISYEDCVDNNITNEFALDGLCADIDMQKQVSTESDVSKEGFMIFHCDSDLNVVTNKDEFTGRFILNGHLAVGTLQYYYWKDDRWIENVLMNDEETVTINPKKLRKQADIKIPACLSDLLGTTHNFPYCYIKTQLGADEDPPLYGEVESAEWSFKTKMLTLKLRYEC